MHTTSYWITLRRPLLASLPFSVSERQSGMFGLLHALESVATLLLMCDGRDLGTAIGERPPSPVDHAEGLQRSRGAAESVATNATSRREGAQYSAQDKAAPRQNDPGTATPGGAQDHEFTPTRMEEVIGANAKEFFEPNLYLFDAYPGGIGFSEPLFRGHDLLVQQTRSLIRACGCDAGCPSCVGPTGDLAPRAKEAALAILDRLCA
jgi:DEAD/DEAH box helicase domain-containing protein